MCGEHGRVNKGIPWKVPRGFRSSSRIPGRIKPGTVIHEALDNVDFKPTIWGCSACRVTSGDEGRDASALFRTGQAPAGWKNVTFSRNSAGNWLMAATSRYKFIVSNDSDPCLFDLDADPFEMRNIFAAPSSRETVRELGRALAEYAKRCKEPHADQPAVRADLAWAAEGTGKYVAPQRNVNRAKTRKVRAAAEDE